MGFPAEIPATSLFLCATAVQLRAMLLHPAEAYERDLRLSAFALLAVAASWAPGALAHGAADSFLRGTSASCASAALAVLVGPAYMGRGPLRTAALSLGFLGLGLSLVLQYSRAASVKGPPAAGHRYAAFALSSVSCALGSSAALSRPVDHAFFLPVLALCSCEVVLLLTMRGLASIFVSVAQTTAVAKVLYELVHGHGVVTVQLALGIACAAFVVIRHIVL